MSPVCRPTRTNFFLFFIGLLLVCFYSILADFIRPTRRATHEFQRSLKKIIQTLPSISHVLAYLILPGSFFPSKKAREERSVHQRTLKGKGRGGRREKREGREGRGGGERGSFGRNCFFVCSFFRLQNGQCGQTKTERNLRAESWGNYVYDVITGPKSSPKFDSHSFEIHFDLIRFHSSMRCFDMQLSPVALVTRDFRGGEKKSFSSEKPREPTCHLSFVTNTPRFISIFAYDESLKCFIHELGFA